MSDIGISAYPLCWPDGWKRTNSYDRIVSKFKSTTGKARDELLWEVEQLIGLNLTSTVLSTNHAGHREPEDPGVAVYFQYKKDQRVCFACDKYSKTWENMVAIRKTIEAIKGIERMGASDMMERALQGFVALPASDWRSELGVRSDAQAALRD